MFFDSDIGSAVDLIGRATPDGGALLVAVDGMGGAGKSTFAAELSARLPGSSLIELDDFYRPMTEEERASLPPRDAYERYLDWRRVLDEALEPLSGRLPARFRRRDWITGSLAEWREVAPGGVVIVEGVYSTRPEFRPLLAAAVYVDTPREQRAARMTARRYEDLDWLDHWMAAEDWYVENLRPAERADLVVDGSGQRRGAVGG